ncbi:hypothetical protein VRB95_08470 [Erwinia aphidicola]|uniref:hypothetical protein n=1 Tax=Erwinia aphidicola TaxID=68334 RepID=UPI0030D1BCAA
MNHVTNLFKQPTPIEAARNHLSDMVEVIQSIKVHDENSQSLRDIAEENVYLALEILSDYLEDLSKQVKS